MRTLNAMAKRGLIKLDKATGETVWWNGQSSKAYYVDDYGPNADTWKKRVWSREAGSCFEYKGNRYAVEYFSGCFCPFVVMK